MRNLREYYVGEKMDNVAYKSNNLLLKWLSYDQKSKKINIVCPGIHVDVDEKNMIQKHDEDLFYEVDDYNLPYGDIVEVYLPFSHRDLETVGKELATLINTEPVFQQYQAIVLIGVGEAGVCFINMAKYLKRNVRIATIATPFFGTGVADRKYFRKKIKGGIAKKLYSSLNRKYNFGNKQLAWNSEFLEEVNYDIMKKHRWINFVASSKGSKLTFQNILERYFGMKLYGNVRNDGITPVVSQGIDSYCKEISISSTRNDALSKALEYFRG